MFAGMDTPLSLIERAYQMARDGECHGVPEIRRRLKIEGYVSIDIAGHLSGRAIRADLTKLCQSARKRLNSCQT